MQTTQEHYGKKECRDGAVEKIN